MNKKTITPFKLKSANDGQPPVSGSLQDRLFELANDFALAKQGDVAVKLHSIHNELRQPPVSSMYCGCQQSQCYLMNGSYICATCNKPIGK